MQLLPPHLMNSCMAELNTKLDVLSLPSHLHQTVLLNVQRDIRQACGITLMLSFQLGQSVRIRKPHHVPKTHNRFTAPETERVRKPLRKSVGSNSYLLSVGMIWNASHLAHVPLVAEQDYNT